MNIADLVVTKGLVAQSKKDTPQLIRITAATTDSRCSPVDLTWHNVDHDGTITEFATASLHFADPAGWVTSWAPLTHLIQGRIKALEELAAEGKANRFSRNMAYTLFASNLVDYADKYRGMQSVVMHELEAFADVKLTETSSGVWTVPPYFIDSVAHLAGFVMNCSDAMDTKANFCVTPGWSSMRFAVPLTPGAMFRSYVKMIPTAEDPQVYLGDVYILQAGTIVGMVGSIKFRRYPRILLSRFFSPPDHATATKSKSQPAPVSAPPPTTSAAPAPAPTKRDVTEQLLPTNMPKASPFPPKSKEAPLPVAPAEVAAPAEGLAAQALELIATESALDVADLKDDVNFSDLGVDSLVRTQAQSFGINLANLASCRCRSSYRRS